MDYVIECRNVNYIYPLTKTPVINDLSISMERGKLYGVIGPNGSGKTTFCHILRGFIPSFFQGTLTGDVLIEGKTPEEYGGELAMKMGFVFQNPFTQASGIKETVFEEIAYGLENFGVPVDEIEKRVVRIMDMTDTTHLAFKNPFELSGGQMQRVALASVLVLDPDILIIDEPTSQLDPEGTESVFKIIRQLKEQKKTIILVEHKVDLIAEYADEVIVFKDGRIDMYGKTADILSDVSLLDKGVIIPQVTMLAKELEKAGFKLAETPVTESHAVELINAALKDMVAYKEGNEYV